MTKQVWGPDGGCIAVQYNCDGLGTGWRCTSVLARGWSSTAVQYKWLQSYSCTSGKGDLQWRRHTCPYQPHGGYCLRKALQLQDPRVSGRNSKRQGKQKGKNKDGALSGQGPGSNLGSHHQRLVAVLGIQIPNTDVCILAASHESFRTIHKGLHRFTDTIFC